MITPAITVMGAIEGLHVATPLFDPYVVPIAVVILIGLFFFQSRGTTEVGSVFGPVTLLWFLALGLLGIYQIVRVPGSPGGDQSMVRRRVLSEQRLDRFRGARARSFSS